MGKKILAGDGWNRNLAFNRTETTAPVAVNTGCIRAADEQAVITFCHQRLARTQYAVTVNGFAYIHW